MPAKVGIFFVFCICQLLFGDIKRKGCTKDATLYVKMEWDSDYNSSLQSMAAIRL